MVSSRIGQVGFYQTVVYFCFNHETVDTPSKLCPDFTEVEWVSNHLVRVRCHIRLNLVGVGQAVGAVEHVNYGNNFSDCFVIQTQPLHGGAVGMNSVNAVVGD